MDILRAAIYNFELHVYVMEDGCCYIYFKSHVYTFNWKRYNKFIGCSDCNALILSLKMKNDEKFTILLIFVKFLLHTLLFKVL